MKAFVKYTYGGPEVLKLEEVEKPPLEKDKILVKVKANSANPADWHILRGKPRLARFSFGLFKPKTKILGADFAGVVEEVGAHVSEFKAGDLVFGESIKGGAFAEYLAVSHHACAKFPTSCSFVDMAATPIAGLTALQCLTTHGHVKAGEKVLINGASGGVGHFAVQIAKSLGAKVTGVCSHRNVDFVKSLGADEVLAYDQENIQAHHGKYDLVVDTHGNLSHKDFKRMGERGIVIGFTTLKHMMKLMLSSSISKFPLIQFTASANSKDLETLAEMIADKTIKVHIEKTYPFDEIPKAIAYIEKMRTCGKVVMIWEH
jgi:NADPH:quinone reductase-like Zn-dependent oxidoreductase